MDREKAKLDKIAAAAREAIDLVSTNVIKLDTSSRENGFSIKVNFKDGTKNDYTFSTNDGTLFISSTKRPSPTELGLVSDNDDNLEILKSNISMFVKGDKNQVSEKKLTKAEKSKKEDIAKAIEKKNPKMPKDKKIAIATSQAKKVAEAIMPNNPANRKGTIETDDENKAKTLAQSGLNVKLNKPKFGQVAEGMGEELQQFKSALYDIAKTALDIYKKIDAEQHQVPDWWKAKIYMAQNGLKKSCGYFDSQNEPEGDITVPMALEGRKMPKMSKTPKPEERPVPKNLKLRDSNPYLGSSVKENKKSSK